MLTYVLYMQNINVEVFKELLNIPHKTKGAKPSFTSIDLISCFWLISEGKTSRANLSVALGLGEGTVRTIISILSNLGYIQADNSGCTLSLNGISKKKELSLIINKVVCLKKQNPLTFNLPSCAIVLSNCKGLVGNGVVQRDRAIKYGADGATTLIVEDGKLMFPEEFEDSQYSKELNEFTIEIKELKDGDTVILSYSNELHLAQRGCWAAALSLLNLNF